MGVDSLLAKPQHHYIRKLTKYFYRFYSFFVPFRTFWTYQTFLGEAPSVQKGTKVRLTREKCKKVKKAEKVHITPIKYTVLL